MSSRLGIRLGGPFGLGDGGPRRRHNLGRMAGRPDRSDARGPRARRGPLSRGPLAGAVATTSCPGWLGPTGAGRADERRCAPLPKREVTAEDHVDAAPP